MDRINIPDEYFHPAYNRTNKKTEKKKKAIKTGFSSILNITNHQEVEQDIELESNLNSTEELGELLDYVHQVGEDLKNNINVLNIKKYKTVVKRFIEIIINKSLTIEEHSSGINILKRKRFTLVQVINTKLERLAAGVLSEQKEQLEILRKVDEINGLLVDLLQ
jgi:uncharacterized protein